MFFIPLRKVDEATRRVFASVDETPDHAREAMDYALAKPQFEKWSAAQVAASGGKSYGNVREMHTKSAVGVVCEPLVLNDNEKSIGFWLDVVDDTAWEKVCRGVYTGVSPGGGYGKTYVKGGIRHYEPVVAELSLVDKPCIPSATFAQFAKADGTVIELELTGVPFEPGRDAIRDRAGALAKSAGDAKRVNDFVVTARSQLIAENAEAEAAELAKLAAPLEDDPAPSSIEDLEKALADARAALAKKDAPKPYGDVEYADPKAGKYPIDTAAHIRAAWSYVNMPKNAAKLDDVEAVKGKIVAAWKAKIDKAGPPSMEKAAAIADLLKSGAAGPIILAMGTVALEKGFYTVQQTAGLLARMTEIADSVIWEERYEQDDDSTLPQAICDQIASLKSFLISMVNEETAEFFAAAEANGGDGIALLAPCFDAMGMMEMSARATDLQKLHAADTELMEKVGKRMSAADGKHVQAMHDHSMSLGAKCDSGNCDAEKMAKLVATSAGTEELAKARRQVAAVLPTIVDLTVAVGDLQKAMGEQKATSDAEIAELRAKLEKIGSGPGPAKGILVSMDKGDDTGTRERGDVTASDPMPEDPAQRQRWAILRKIARGEMPAPGGDRQY